MAFNINVSFSGKAAKLAAKTADAVIKYGEFAKEQTLKLLTHVRSVKEFARYGLPKRNSMLSGIPKNLKRFWNN